MPRKKTITGVIYENEAQFAGSYPDIPISETVLGDLQEIYDESGKKPMFVTLPVGFTNAESRNGRKYNETTAKAILEAINSDKPIGQRGHLREDERPYRFDVPPLVWVAAENVNGTIWGKAYVMEAASDVREYIRATRAVKGKIGTSIYGTAEVDKDGNVENLTIESIDLGHPGRLGIPQAAATPQISQETDMGEQDEANETEAPDTEPDHSEIEAEPEKEPDMGNTEHVTELTVKVSEQRQQINTLEAEVREHKEYRRTVDEVQELLKVSGGDAIMREIRGLMDTVEELQDDNDKLLFEVMDYMIERKVRTEHVRPIVRRIVEMKKPRTRHELEMAIDDTLREPDIRKLRKGEVIETMGPPVGRPAKNDRSDQAWKQYLDYSQVEDE